MKLIKVEVSDILFEQIKSNANKAGLSEERFIAEILSRYVIDPHIMESKEVRDGYVACGPINLEISNL